MKVPPKRKGNNLGINRPAPTLYGLNESPSEKEGKSAGFNFLPLLVVKASMKVPPKRKGNPQRVENNDGDSGLNESPSEKEGKWLHLQIQG